jgi:nucleotide-binding universal stress UspA family protein
MCTDFYYLDPKSNTKLMTIIVPTDFSQIADDAARYAAQMLKGKPDVNLLLLHVYDKAGEKDEAEILIERLKDELQTNHSVNVEVRLERAGNLIDIIERLVRHADAKLVVMGFSGKERMEQTSIGSNTLKMIEKNVCPILVIPPTAQYFEVNDVCLLSDFKDVQQSIPDAPIKNILRLLKPSLHIINVNSNHYVSLTPEYMAERSRMLEMFSEFKPEFYFIGTYDLHETVQTFVHDKHIDLLITIPRNHSFFGSLFKTSNTKKLILESNIPILAAHE